MLSSEFNIDSETCTLYTLINDVINRIHFKQPFNLQGQFYIVILKIDTF